MKRLISLMGLVLVSCAPHVETRIQRVYCVTPEQYKTLKDAEPGHVALTHNAQKDFKLVAGQDILLRKYADGLLDVIGNCIGTAP